MPTYEYECPHCGNHFEKYQSMAAAPLKTCPQCGKPVRRLIGKGSGIIFKGSGFHATDYAKESRSSCQLAMTGKTCCGRTSRCDLPACDN